MLALKKTAKRLAHAAWPWAWRWLDGLAVLGASPTQRSGVLVVRLDAIGDFVLWLDAASALRALFPGQRITLCVNAACADLARPLPHWDEVWPVDLKRLSYAPRYRLSLLRRVRSAGFDTAVQPTFSRAFLTGDALLRASAARQRLGSVGDLSNISPGLKAVSDRWYTRLVPASPQPMMELQRNAEFVRHLGAKTFTARLPQWPLTDASPTVRRLLPGVGRYMVLFPGASWTGKQWPLQNFAAAAAELHRQHGWTVVVCGADADTAACQALLRQCPAGSVSLAGQTRLPELAAVLQQAQLLISNDTSAVHLAAAVSTPAVCVLGGGHFGRFLPYPPDLAGNVPQAAHHTMHCYNCNWRCTQPHPLGGPVPCISGVSVASVLRHATQAILHR